MEDFFTTYKSHIIYGILIIVGVIVLHFLTDLLHKWLLRKERKKFPGERATSVNLVKRVLNALWLVLGFICLSFIFVNEEKYTVLKDDFKLVLYLGVLAVFHGYRYYLAPYYYP